MFLQKYLVAIIFIFSKYKGNEASGCLHVNFDPDSKLLFTMVNDGMLRMV